MTFVWNILFGSVEFILVSNTTANNYCLSLLQVFNVNLRSVFELTRVLLPSLIENKGITLEMHDL